MRFRGSVFAVLGLALLGAGLAQAAETSRAEYKAAVEPICQRNTEANKKLLRGVKSEVRRHKWKPAARQLAGAAAALRKALGELEAVPQPAEDQARLAKWLGYVKTEIGLLQRLSKQVKAGQTRKITGTQLQIEHNIILANNTVLAFEFHYCKFNLQTFM